MTTAALDALRSAAPEPYFVLDGDDRVLHVSPHLRDTRGIGVGHVFWDDLPRGREAYGPAFDEARRTGQPVEALVYYAGELKRLLAIPSNDGLAVHVETLAELDVTTLGTLTRSLSQIESALVLRAPAPPGRRSPGSLRALP